MMRTAMSETETTALGSKRGRGETREMVLALTLRGHAPATVARMVGITRQGVADHLKRLREQGILVTPGDDAA